MDFPFPIQGDGEGLDSAIARHAAIRWQMIGDAIRSYLVAGAARLYLSGCRLSNVPSVPVSLDALRKALPATHSMLYHPSALKEAHFAGAEDIARWSRAIPGRESEVVLPIDESGEPLLSVDETGLLRRLDFEEDRWEKWLSYSSSTSFLRTPRSEVPGDNSGKWQLHLSSYRHPFPPISGRGAPPGTECHRPH